MSCVGPEPALGRVWEAGGVERGGRNRISQPSKAERGFGSGRRRLVQPCPRGGTDGLWQRHAGASWRSHRPSGNPARVARLPTRSDQVEGDRRQQGASPLHLLDPRRDRAHGPCQQPWSCRVRGPQDGWWEVKDKARWESAHPFNVRNRPKGSNPFEGPDSPFPIVVPGLAAREWQTETPKRAETRTADVYKMRYVVLFGHDKRVRSPWILVMTVKDPRPSARTYDKAALPKLWRPLRESWGRSASVTRVE